MLVMEYDIQIGNYLVGMLDSVTINRSVETLVDTAKIVIPGHFINAPLKEEDKIKVGDKVTIMLGYDEDLKTEFEGYLKAIHTDDGSITLECEDQLYKWRIPVADRELKDIRLKTVLQTVVNEVNKKQGTAYKVDCDYDFLYSKFVFMKAKAYDVLASIQKDCKANVWFDGDTLHVHAPYSRIKNEMPVLFDFARNIESSDLKYVKAVDKNIEVEVSYNDKKGAKKNKKYGVTGGQKVEVTANSSDEESVMKLAKSTYNLWCYDGFEGSFTGWLVPFVEPTNKVEIRDGERGTREVYYVLATETSFSSSGGVRKITIGRRLS